jgi:hypothetical protein
MTAKKRVDIPADLPAYWELPDIAAIQALEKGTATPEQQVRALTWVINNACGTYDLCYHVNDREHAFASGRRFVGLQVVKMLKLNAGKFKE